MVTQRYALVLLQCGYSEHHPTDRLATHCNMEVHYLKHAVRNSAQICCAETLFRFSGVQIMVPRKVIVKFTRIMMYQRNLRVHPGQEFISSFDAPY